MVQRVSDAVQFQGGQGTQVASSGLGNASPDFEQYRTSHDFAAPVNPNNGYEGLVDAIVGVGQKVGGEMFKTSTEEAYLKGAAQAGTLQSEKDLDSNPFTKSWATAGYRDTMGRIAIADNESRIQQDMPKLREQSPEAFNAYLAQRRAELMPSLEGMSRQQRLATFQNIALNERAAIKLHTSEYMKFQIETENRSIQAGGSASFAQMDRAKGDVDAYKTATDSSYAYWNASINQNPKLTPAMKQKLTGEYAEAALANDHQGLYKMLRDVQVPLSGGGTGSALTSMSWDDQVKLSKTYRESLSRTAVSRTRDLTDKQATMEAGWENPDTPMPAYAEVQGFATEAIDRGLFKEPGTYESFMERYAKAGVKKAEASGMAQAFTAGDQGAMIRAGKTPDEAFDAWKRTTGRHLAPAAYSGELLRIGLQTGQPQAFNELGKQITPGLAQLGLSTGATDAGTQNIATVMTAMDAAEKTGKTGVSEAVMSSMNDQQRSKFMSIREKLAQTGDMSTAVLLAQKQEDDEAKLTPQLRKALGESQAKDDIEDLKGLDPKGLFGRLNLKMRFLSSQAGNLSLAGTSEGWTENSERAQEVAAQMKYAAIDELRSLSVSHPMMSKDARWKAAMSAVAARTVVTASGPMAVPKGTTVQSYFGVPAEVFPDQVGQALDLSVHAADGNRVVYKIANGTMVFEERTKNGLIARTGIIDPKQVAPMIEAKQKADIEDYQKTSGKGGTVNGVTFNGDNTQGLSNKFVYDMRAAVLTNGTVAIKPGTPIGPATKADFLQMTDAAASASRLPMQTTGKAGASAFELFSAFNIKTGNKFTQMQSFRPLLEAMKGSDPAAGQTALLASKWYKEANPAEQAWAKLKLTKAYQGE